MNLSSSLISSASKPTTSAMITLICFAFSLSKFASRFKERKMAAISKILSEFPSSIFSKSLFSNLRSHGAGMDFFLALARRSLRLGAIFAWFPLILHAGDSPLPSSASLLGNSQGAFANPAAAALGSDGEFSAAFAEEDFTWSGKGQTFWSAHDQGRGHAEGLRYWRGGGNDHLRFDLAAAHPVAGFFTLGIKGS